MLRGAGGGWSGQRNCFCEECMDREISWLRGRRGMLLVLWCWVSAMSAGYI